MDCSTSLQTSGSHILVVEDHPDILELLKSLLEYKGYEVTGATNGLEALTLLRSGLSPCLVLLDLEMPVMSGEELKSCMANDENLRGIPVVVMSASLGAVQLLGNHLKGIPKTISIRDLMAVVEQHCAPLPSNQRKRRR